MATYEGKWRCVRCRAANLGRHLNCQTCGVKRGDDIEFFLEDEAAAISDTELLKQANAGTDWICRYCDGNNRAFSAQCSSCGSMRSDKDKQLIEETRGVSDWSEEAQKSFKQAAQMENLHETQSNKPSAFKRWLKIGLIGAGGLTIIFVALFAGLVYLASLTYPAEVEITGLEWTRAVAVEEYKTVAETAWEGEVPPDARIQSSERALHHTEKVADGTRSIPETYTEQISDGTESYVCGRTSKKNGYFEDKYCTRTKYKSVTRTRNKTETVYKDVPVYRTRYNYEIEKWVTVDEKTTSGTDFNPQWAFVQTDKTHREGKRAESYNLICKELGGENKIHKVKLTPENWSSFQIGERLESKKDFFGFLVEIDKIGKISNK